jgi:hypothetical protein
MLTKSTFAILTAAMALGVTAQAGSITLDISATTYGCSNCDGSSNVNPGMTLSNIYSPKLQLMLGPGTYTITNGDTTPGDTYSAWNFQGYPTTQNWVWSFLVANDANSQVLMDDYIAGVYATQIAASSATGIATWDGPSNQLSATSTAGFTDTLVLASPTLLDFMIDDYILSDNGGGVALTITGPGIGTTVPEPSAFVPLGLSLVALAARRLLR